MNGNTCRQEKAQFNWPCFVYLSSRGLFITIHDRSHISTLLQSWPEKDIRVSSAFLHLHHPVLLHNVPELLLFDTY